MKQTYILAISGGVDSVVLLHKLAAVKPERIHYIVAHVDHGTRKQSADDASFVQRLAKQYGFAYESTRLQLGKDASEAQARELRYAFLHDLKRRYKAEGIITAHHQDDVLETMVVNLLRGTTARGLIGFTQPDVIRPFLKTPKQDLIDYAQANNLVWCEDETNAQTTYLRNYVRHNIMPRLQDHREEFIAVRERLLPIYLEIDTLCRSLLVQSTKRGELLRSRFVILPVPVQHELLAFWFRLENIPFDEGSLQRASVAIKTFFPGKSFPLKGNACLIMDKKTILLKNEGGTV